MKRTQIHYYMYNIYHHIYNIHQYDKVSLANNHILVLRFPKLEWFFINLPGCHYQYILATTASSARHSVQLNYLQLEDNPFNCSKCVLFAAALLVHCIFLSRLLLSLFYRFLHSQCTSVMSPEYSSSLTSRVFFSSVVLLRIGQDPEPFEI